MKASSLRERAVIELREFIVLSIYLWICFGALLVYKSAILRSAGVAFLPLGFAAIKAVVSAKFLMIGNFLPIAARRRGEPLIQSMLRKSMLLLVLLVALTLIEEAVLAAVHGRPVSEALLGLGGGSTYQVGATLLIMLLILFPYVGFRTLAEAIGAENLLALLISKADADVVHPER